MRLLFWILLLIPLFFCLFSCDNAESFKKGYMKGYNDKGEAFKSEGQNMRAELLGKLESKFIVGAFFAVLATLFGATVAEKSRSKISEWLRLSTDTQAVIAKRLYLSAVIGCMTWCLLRYGLIMSTPMAILLAGTVHPFWFKYLPAMKCSDVHTSKTALSKVKALFFYAFIIAITCELLSDSAFIDIRPS